MSVDDAGRVAGGSGGPMSERMQALLSRAAEEQLTEQRQVSAALADLHQLVAGLGEQLRAVREQVAGVASAVAALQDDSALPSLVLGVAALREEVEQVAASVTSSVQEGLTEKVRAASVDSERRLSAHVDEAILALAEGLQRGRLSTRGAGGAAVPGEPVSGSEPPVAVEVVTDDPDAAAVAPHAEAEVERSDGAGSSAKVAPRSRFLDDGDAFPDVEAADLDDGDAFPDVEAADVDEPDVAETPASPAEPEPAVPVPSAARTAVTTSTAPRRYQPPPPRPPSVLTPAPEQALPEVTPGDTVPQAAADDEDGLRRRPWWRPGG